MAAESIPHRFFATAERRPYEPAYHVRRDGAWVPTNWKTYADEVRRAARALIALGFEPGNKVTILGFNRPEWTIFNMAAMAAGGVSAGIYTTCSAEEVQYIVDHSESLVTLVENADQWEKIRRMRDRLPRLRHVVLMKGASVDDPMVLGWEQFLAKGDGVDDSRVDGRMDALEPDGLATLIYTSGTTGPPKGVMLSNRNLVWTAETMNQLSDLRPGDCALSYLPLSHIAEQMMTIHGPATTGAAIYFAESIEKVPDNLKEVQPTAFFGVPRIWEKFHAGVSAKLAAATGAKKRLIAWTRRVCTRVNELRNRGREPGPLLLMQYKLADKLVLSKLKPALGLGRARLCVSGAAPVAREILEFFASLDIVIHEVYGQSEDNGPTSFNTRGANRFGTVGKPIPGIEVKIAADDEILVKGPNVFLGYYKEPEATAECLKDGWLYSGDLGKLDADGYLSITGRKKEIIITAGGKNIAPKNIEAALKNHDLISEAVVIGDRRKFLSVLVTLDEEQAKKLDGNGAAAAAVQRAIDEVNQTLAKVEQIKKFTILPRPLTIEHGELTPTLKVKRKIVHKNFSSEIEAMYAE
jgi:long-chain acyl-CoA synthetase